ncbi:proline racemase [Paenibacillus oralis]|uniref:Proline racemase n=1 Tax=Paenibacillus oralis TaxID=2490856 RepID=A0A3P3U5Z9_9BACL|nr:proline racemase family protein [Paenibacillus oralis]RRJ65705.1 proline racemase [Paenibacillus oralis]
MKMKRWYAAIDTHSGGEPLRIITGGLPPLAGATLQEKADFFRRNFDAARKLLLAEPRGHGAMTGAVVTAPVTKGVRFGLLFLNQEGLAAISGHGIIAAVTAWIATGQLEFSDAAAGVLIDCPAGTVRAIAECEGEEVHAVTIEPVPSFAYDKPLTVNVEGAEVRVDIGFSGELYAVVDASLLGVRGAYPLPKLREWARLIRGAAERRLQGKHSVLDWDSGIHGVFFYRRGDGLGSRREASLDDRDDDRDPARIVYRSAAVFAGEQLDRSPGGAGACAHLAVLYSRGLLARGQQVVYEGITGARAIGTISGETMAYDRRAVIPRFTGTAHVLGFMNFLLDPADPLPEGFILY